MRASHVREDGCFSFCLGVIITGEVEHFVFIVSMSSHAEVLVPVGEPISAFRWKSFQLLLMLPRDLVNVSKRFLGPNADERSSSE